MKSSELRALSLEDLQQKEEETVKSLYQLRVQATMKELGNTAQIRDERRSLARIKQAIAEKRGAGSTSSGASSAGQE